MQTRLPARLPAPKLLSLAHVISLEQSREEGRGVDWRQLEREREREGGRERGGR